MNVGQLRKAIAHLPDDMPVMTDDGEAPMCEPDLYIAPAHRRGRWGISEGHLNPQTDWARKVYGEYENIHVLLVSGFGHADAENITPEAPSVIDGAIAHREIEAP